VFVGFADIKDIYVQQELAFYISLPAMDVNGLVSLVRVQK
jgi:hypothetical protein